MGKMKEFAMDIENAKAVAEWYGPDFFGVPSNVLFIHVEEYDMTIFFWS